jgi:hypothetical protein
MINATVGVTVATTVVVAATNEVRKPTTTRMGSGNAMNIAMNSTAPTVTRIS